jgi:uncharacterized iron-regulated protein
MKLAALAACVVVAGCHGEARVASSPNVETPKSELAWKTTLDRDHPLVGKIYDAERGAFVDDHALVERLVRARVALLGEKHDNVDHHRLQAAMVLAMAERGRKPAVAFEMLDADEQSIVTAAMLEHPKDADAIGQAVRWDQKGWPPWPAYAPIFRAAVEHDLPIVAANMPLATVRAIAHGGLAAVDEKEVARLGLDTPMDKDKEQSLAEELREAHCGHLPERAIAPMVLAQRARDAEMADRLQSNAVQDGAILIAGDGHVRKDRGVPSVLGVMAPKLDTVSVAFVEVARGTTDPRAYASIWHATKLPFDFVWFTPRASDADPCAAFRGK